LDFAIPANSFQSELCICKQRPKAARAARRNCSGNATGHFAHPQSPDEHNQQALTLSYTHGESFSLESRGASRPNLKISFFIHTRRRLACALPVLLGVHFSERIEKVACERRGSSRF
jgi:hypothetical protein